MTEGGDAALWLQSFVLAAGVVVAVLSIKNQRRSASERVTVDRKLAAERTRTDRDIASKRASLDFISAYEIHTGADWAHTVSTALKVLDNRDRWLPLLSTPSAELADAERLVRHRTLTFLNHFELVAIGIRSGALDKQLYLDWFGPSYKAYWARSSNAVAFLRDNGHPDAFREFSDLAETIPD